MRWDVILERRTRNRLNPETTRKKLRRIAESAERNKDLGFVGRVGKLHEPALVIDEETKDEVHRYLVKLRLEKPNVRSEDAARRQFEHILKVVARCAGSEGWSVFEPGAAVAQPAEAMSREGLAERIRPARTPQAVPQLTPDAMADLLEGIYERDSHVRIIHDAVRNYCESRALHAADPRVEIARSHVLLKGKPAGCKTKLFERLKAWYERGSDVERVKFIDAHATTKAGLENYLLDKAEAGALPEIIVLEEIEKQSPDNMLALVSVMGSGYIAKLNAITGPRREVANVLVWATCNQEDIIKNFRAGVLWSRFTHKLHCTRPNRQLMRRILLDQVAKTGGNPLWVDKVMEFAYDLMPKLNDGRPMDDPREIKGLLDGRDRLLDESYQRDLVEIIKAQLLERHDDSSPSVSAA